MNIEKYKICKQGLYEIFSLMFAIILFVVGTLENSGMILFGGNLAISAIIVFYSLNNLKRRVAVLLFDISFFTFLLCGFLFKDIAEIQENSKALVLTFISLLSLYIGCLVYERFNFKIRKKIRNRFITERDIKNIQKLSELAFYLTVIFYWLVEFEKIFVKQTSGYVGLYIGFNSSLPFIVQKLAVMNSSFFIIFLATFPSAKKTYGVLGTYMVGLTLDLLTGVRGNFVTSVMFIFAYVIIRNRTNEYEYLLSSKKVKPVLVAGGFGMICFMGIYSQIRLGNDFTSFLGGFSSFFQELSGSIGVLKHSIINQVKIRELYPWYSGYSIVNYNVIFKNFINSLFGITSTQRYIGNLGYTGTYFRDKLYFQRGGSFGTQYIAEIYLDFSFIGVILFNIFLGSLLIIVTKNTSKDSVIKNLFAFSIMKMLFFLPRDTTFSFLTTFFSITNLASCFALIMICGILRSRQKGIKVGEG